MLQRCVLAGATGLVGGELARALAGDRRCAQLHLLLRRPASALEALPGASALRWSGPPMPPLPPVDTALCALGTTIAVAGSQAAFRAVDFDAVLAFAEAAGAAGARRFALVSALGADARSRVFYNRVKGEIEQAVARLRFDSTVIVRPSLLLGDRAALGQPRRSGEGIAQALAPVLAWIAPRRLRPVAAETVALALLAAADEGRPGLRVIESDALPDLAKRWKSSSSAPPTR